MTNLRTRTGHPSRRVESNVTVPHSRAELTQKLLDKVALSFVGPSATWDGDKLRLAGILPDSLDLVYVLVICAADAAGHGKFLACCDHALVVNSIMNLLKRAITEEKA